MNTLQTHTLIIGAASGMGQRIAKQLYKTGKLSLADINLRALNDVA